MTPKPATWRAKVTNKQISTEVGGIGVYYVDGKIVQSIFIFIQATINIFGKVLFFFTFLSKLQQHTLKIVSTFVQARSTINNMHAVKIYKTDNLFTSKQKQHLTKIWKFYVIEVKTKTIKSDVRKRRISFSFLNCNRNTLLSSQDNRSRFVAKVAHTERELEA